MAVLGDRLTVSFQENLLVLLCFSPSACTIIRNSIPERLFSQQLYRELVSRIYQYIDEQKAPPGDHLPDLLDAELEGDGKQAEQVCQLLEALYAQRTQVSEPYVMGRLEQFVRQQSLKTSIIAASESIQAGELDKAEQELQEGLKQRITAFSPGITLDQGLAFAYAGQTRIGIVSTGIKELDRWGLGPAKGELHLFVAPAKRGKTWWLVNIAKQAMLHRQSVVYITLEINERQIAQRMVQSMLSIQRSKARVPVTRIRTDDLGRLLRLEEEVMPGRLSFDDNSTKPLVEKRLKRLYGRGNIFIKQFPAGSLTVPTLNTYLDMLERTTGFVPDVLVLDYPDLMRVNADNYRIDLGSVYVKLRGLAVERNLALACATQSNREGAGARMVLDTHTGEDWSKIATADTVFTYSQGIEERKLGLARLFVSNSRVADKDRFIVLISQSYPTGQFVLDSVSMSDSHRYEAIFEQAKESGVGAGNADAAEE